MNYLLGSSLLLGWAVSSRANDGAYDARSITFSNNCDKDIWIDITPGAAPYAASTSHCSANTDCIEGSYCDMNNGICFWNIPVPSTGNYRLEKQSSGSVVTFPILKNDIVWSGNIVACKDGTCSKSADECDATGCRVNSTSPRTLVMMCVCLINCLMVCAGGIHVFSNRCRFL
jgi:hypothetical protein